MMMMITVVNLIKRGKATLLQALQKLGVHPSGN